MFIKIFVKLPFWRYCGFHKKSDNDLALLNRSASDLLSFLSLSLWIKKTETINGKLSPLIPLDFASLFIGQSVAPFLLKQKSKASKIELLPHPFSPIILENPTPSDIGK